MGDQTTAIIVGMVTGFDNYSISLQWGVIASIYAEDASLAGFPKKPGGYLSQTYGKFFLLLFLIISYFLIGVAVTALIFSMIGLIIGSVVIYFIFRGRSGFAPLLNPDNSNL